MNGKTCIVTGSTSGIGFETAKALALLGANTLIVGRNEKKCKQTIRKIIKTTGNLSVDYLLADLSSQNDICRLSEQFKSRYARVDVLVNNAGAKIIARHTTVDGYEMTFALNHLAYFMLTLLLLDCLKSAGKARIINVSSGAHTDCPGIDFDDLHGEKVYVGKRAYAQSKLANLLFTYELARRLEGTGVTVNAVHPGGVATNFCMNNGLKSWLKHITAHLMAGNLVGPAEGAKTSIYLATSPEVEGISGKYFADRKSILASEASYDREAAERLWEVSLKLTGLTHSP